MFTTVKNWFFGVTPTNKETTVKASVITTPNGAMLINSNGDVLGTYSRRRDAVRGAARKGILVLS